MNTQRSNNSNTGNPMSDGRTYKRGRAILFTGMLLGLLIMQSSSYAQVVYNPIAVTGYQHDVIAEAGNSVLATTTTMIDGSPNVARHVLYSQAFAAANGLTGGMVDNGRIVSGTRTYQINPYNENNALYLSRTGLIDSTKTSGTLKLVTPGYYARMSLMAFSTEGSSSLNINITYTDGTTERALTNAPLSDWYVGTTSVVYMGPGRVGRDTVPPFLEDGVGSWPRFFQHDFITSCLNQHKMVESVTIIDTASSTASRVVVLAVSGESIQPYAISSTVLPARCGITDNGTISLSITGGVKPFTYAWNTTPAQTTPFAAGLAAGTYTVNVKDSNGCVRPYTATVTLVTPAPVTAHATKLQVCLGAPTTLYADTTGITPGTYTYRWNPGTVDGAAVTITPVATTKYYVDAEDQYGCASADTVEVIVLPAATAVFTVNPENVCPNTQQVVTYTGNGTATATYNWNAFAGATVQYGAGAGPYGIVFNTAGTYTIKLDVSVNGCTTTASKQITVNGALPTPMVTVAAVTSSSVAFSWQPVAGATGYIVSVNGGPYISPTSGSKGTTHNVVNLQPGESITISVIALGLEECMNSAIGKATGTTTSDGVFIPNSFSPNSDGKNDFFKAYGNGVSELTMKVFNQWGERIFEGKDNTAGWDGKHNGKMQPLGVYFYVIKIRFADGTESIRKGAVNLLR